MIAIVLLTIARGGSVAIRAVCAVFCWSRRVVVVVLAFNSVGGRNVSRIVGKAGDEHISLPHALLVPAVE